MNSHRRESHTLNMISFTDLERGTRFRNVLIDDELDTRIAEASAALGRLHRNVGNKEASD